jgi:hypothetical protein
MAAVKIAGDLDLIDGEEFNHPIERHGFDRADEIARALRGDLFFTGDKRGGGLALGGDDAVIDLARQQPERQAIMPLEWPSMRSMARWVLPVLVGPRTALILARALIGERWVPAAAISSRSGRLGRPEDKPVKRLSVEENKNESIANQSG